MHAVRPIGLHPSTATCPHDNRYHAYRDHHNQRHSLFHKKDHHQVTKKLGDPRDALCALMLVLAIDADKCSRQN